jgi:hypothetical protein
MRGLKKGLTALTATAACFAALGTGSALASSLTLSNGALSYTGAAAEANHVTFSFDLAHAVFVVQDTGVAGITVSSSTGGNKQLCQNYGPQTVYCNWLSVASVNAHLGNGGSFGQSKLTFTPIALYAGNGNDTLIGGGGATTLVGGAGTTSMTGGSGHTVYQGGSGADSITSRNGVTENVTCGAGADNVTADTADSAAADCETVDKGAGQPPVETGTTDVPTGGGDAPALHAPLPEIAPHPVSVTKDTRIPIEVTCPASAVAGCQGTIALDLAGASAASGNVTASRRIKRRISKPKKFRLAAGSKMVVRVALSRRGARKFKSAAKRHKALKVLVTVAMRSEAGTHKATRTITVHASRRSRGSQKVRGRK